MSIAYLAAARRASAKIAANFRLGDRTVANPSMRDIFVGWMGALPKLSGTLSGSHFVISWPVVPDRVSYSVQYSSSPGSASWTSAGVNVYLKDGQQVVTNETGEGPRFYRLVVTPQEL